jgi:putative FmdB family regulatory protein
MPIYEYLCDDCGAHYERIVMSQKQSITCPKCESAKHTIQLSVFAAPANGSKTSRGSSSGPASGSGGACCGGGLRLQLIDSRCQPTRNCRTGENF